MKYPRIVSFKVLFAVLFTLVLAPAPALAQDTPALEREIVFPNVPGYLTLKADLHIHSVFSDGSVWPSIRVEEALRDGLDAIATTDHLEYQPHSEDIPHPDRNRAHEIASAEAEETDLMVIAGAEITRSMPPGHNNAVFIQDANKLLIDDPIEVFREVQRQGGFAFWDHPYWPQEKPDQIPRLSDMHRQLIDEGLLSGIEVINGHEFSEEALAIALEHDLAILGTSDVHGLIDWDYEVHHGGHRPVTLIFATTRSQEAMLEALQARRTVAYAKNMLVGKEEHLVPLLEASINVSEASYQDERLVLSVLIENPSDVSFLLNNRSDFTFHQDYDLVVVEAQKTTIVQVKTLEALESLELEFEVMNAVTAPNTHPTITLQIDVSE